jgi:hypothetical protein
MCLVPDTCYHGGLTQLRVNFSSTEFSEARIQQYGYFQCSTSLNGKFAGT